MLLIVLGVVVLLALVVLGALGYALVGALGRLTREMTALQDEVVPVATQLQAALATAAESRRPGADA
ncbi:hypothetical protein TEK04_06100 [Klenkia sp. LSe6-5]|uniref:Uncharacterized protein n=1 Tax=Klenkia sesuvii TaxID=3103137 RepID=A0ABU8DR25_9ACTN